MIAAKMLLASGRTMILLDGTSLRGIVLLKILLVNLIAASKLLSMELLKKHRGLMLAAEKESIILK